MRNLYLLPATLAMATPGLAQKPDKPPVFEVAVIKPAAPDARGMGVQLLPGGGVNMKNVTLMLLVTMAWDVRDFQVAGAPAWANAEHFDILAKPESEIPNTPAGRAQLMLAVQALMRDRFGLVFHREEKELQVYALTVAKNGPKLTPGAPDTQNSLMGGRGKLEGKNQKMTDLARMLSNNLGRTVVDKTGLTGAWDFKLTWTPDFGEANGPKGMPPEATKEPPQTPDGPSIFTALQEQLGLKLESQKGPVEMLVIDRAEKPSEN